jgi:hypothetical protein
MRVGDAIAHATMAAGIRPCGGCKKRAEALNRIFDARSRAETGPDLVRVEMRRIVAARLAGSLAIGTGALLLRRRLSPR